MSTFCAGCSRRLKGSISILVKDERIVMVLWFYGVFFVILLCYVIIIVEDFLEVNTY